MSIQERLDQKNEEFKSLELARKHLENIEQRLLNKKKQSLKLKAILEKEYNDVIALEKLSIEGLFVKFLGDKEARMELERQEYLTAALNYNESIKSIELIEFEKQVLQKKLQRYDVVKSEYYNLIRQREASLVIEDPLAKQLITTINQDHDQTIALKREIHEALIVGTKIKKSIDEIVSNLTKVANWGHILLPPNEYIKKMVFVNRAKEKAYTTKQLLEAYEDELFDIYRGQNIQIENYLRSFKNFIHELFDNLISDWIIAKKIHHSLNTVHQVKAKVSRVNQSLTYELQQADQKLNELKRKKNDIIQELN